MTSTFEQDQHAQTESSIAGAYKTWAQRNGFSDWALALIWLFLCLTVFQFIAVLVAGGGYFLFNYFFNYETLMQILESFREGNVDLMSDYLGFLFLTNSTWQILFLGLGSYLFVRVCSGKDHRKRYLRLKKGKSLLVFTGISMLLIVTVQPTIWFTGWINSFIPVPEFFESIQQSQMDLIGDFLKDDPNVWLALFNVALVPAVCEEVLFRGFVMRSFERGWGIKASIILSGLLFGMYHIQVSNLLPLALIGILLAVIAWKANSIYPAMAAHFVNNGASVVIAVYYPDSSMAELSPQAMPPIGLVAASVVISGYLIYLMFNNPIKKPTP